LSAVKNPFDPILQESSWRAYDNQLVIAGIIPLGCEEYTARIAQTDKFMSDPEIEAEIERAVDDIVRVDPINCYKKVVCEVEDD
jgi:hypothetical protein